MPMATDEQYLRRAIELAHKGCGHVRPNPPVGAVIVRNGHIIGEGWHRRAGLDHAEVSAIKNARRRGESTNGSTIYVTLEPCSRAGRVGACTDAIIAAGITRVVYGAVDPNPTNRGRAKRILAKSRIACNLYKGDAARECARLIRPFAKHVTSGLPFVTVKIAMSLDGKICDDYGNARWISSAAARKQTGKFRESVDAIMVGAETVRADNPSLLSHARRNDDLVRVVVSKSGRLPKDAQIFTDKRNTTLVYRDAKEAIEKLGALGMTHVFCEGGLKLARSLAAAGLVDEWIAVIAPKVIGSSPIDEAAIIPDVSVIADTMR